MATSNHVFSAFSFIGFVLVCIPFPWHLEAWNTGTCLFMVWTALSCLALFINSVVWNDNTINWAPVWCDITARLIVGASVAIPAASLCINRRLYQIASVRSVTRTKAEKRRAIMGDLAIGVGIPVLVMILQYIVQGHRFNIFEDVGCYPTTYNTAPAYVLVFAVPVVIGLVSGTYSVLSIMAFKHRQAEFKEILSSSANLNSNRYFRLMALAGTEVLCCVPLGLATILIGALKGDGVQPWISWEDTHADFSRVDQIPAIIWRSDPTENTSVEMTRWLFVVCAFVFFLFFGFADEAQKHYKLAFNSLAKRAGYSMPDSATKVGSGVNSSGRFNFGSKGLFNVNSKTGAIPVYVSKEIVQRRDSLDTEPEVKSLKDCGNTLAPSSTCSTLTESVPRVPARAVVGREGGKMLDPPATLSMASIYSTSSVGFPSSITVSDSFLDLSVTCVDEPPIRDRNAADNLV